MGWLHATPKGMKATRFEVLIAQRDKAIKKGREPDDLPLPVLDQNEYLLELMHELAPIRADGMGVSWTDWDIILPFSQSKGLDDDDTSILALMCREYYAAQKDGEKPLSIAPMLRTKEGE